MTSRIKRNIIIIVADLLVLAFNIELFLKVQRDTRYVNLVVSILLLSAVLLLVHSTVRLYRVEKRLKNASNTK